MKRPLSRKKFTKGSLGGGIARSRGERKRRAKVVEKGWERKDKTNREKKKQTNCTRNSSRKNPGGH